jgi:hypothetical protein
MKLQEWGETQKQKIHDDNDKPLFEEIVGCLQAGFLRSSYIMSWIGIAENLKNKILQSSNLGDAAAAAALVVIQDAENNKKSVDKIILEKAGELNLIDSNERNTLEYLWTQRCVFAHPYETSPNEEQVKHIINQLVEICLSKPLLYKKGFLSELINNIVTKPFFLTGDKQKQMDYFSSILPRVTSDLHPFLFKTLLGELGKIESDQSKTSTQFTIRYFLLKLFTYSPLPLNDTKWALEHRAVNFPYTMLFGCISEQTWPKFTERIKDILFNYAIGEPDLNKQPLIKAVIYRLVEQGELESPYQHEYFGYLNNSSFLSSIRFYGDKEQMHNRIHIELDSGNYDKQNTVLEYIKSEDGIKFLANSSEVQQRNIGMRLMYASRNNNWNITTYLNNFPTIPAPSISLLLGMQEASLFNRTNGLYVDLTRFIKAVNLLKDLPLAEALKNIEELEAQISVLPEDATHHINEATIDAAKLSLEGLDGELLEKTKVLLDKLKPFEFKWPEI